MSASGIKKLQELPTYSVTVVEKGSFRAKQEVTLLLSDDFASTSYRVFYYFLQFEEVVSQEYRGCCRRGSSQDYFSR